MGDIPPLAPGDPWQVDICKEPGCGGYLDEQTNTRCTKCGKDAYEDDPDEWREVAPVGPQPTGDVGGDDQTGEAYSRRWEQPHPDGDGVLRTTITSWAMDDGKRRWIATETEWQHIGADGQERQSWTDESDSLTDTDAADVWPSDEDVRAEVAQVIEPPAWDETPLRDCVRGTAEADRQWLGQRTLVIELPPVPPGYVSPNNPPRGH